MIRRNIRDSDELSFDKKNRTPARQKQSRYGKRLITHRGEGCALIWPDWYCKVASNIDSAITTLFSISASEAMTSSYFSCTNIYCVRRFSNLPRRLKHIYKILQTAYIKAAVPLTSSLNHVNVISINPHENKTTIGCVQRIFQNEIMLQEAS